MRTRRGTGAFGKASSESLWKCDAPKGCPLVAEIKQQDQKQLQVEKVDFDFWF